LAQEWEKQQAMRREKEQALVWDDSSRQAERSLMQPVWVMVPYTLLN
jgi:hypothetical protein